MINPYKPTAAFIGASWAAVLLGIGAYLVGLWNAAILLSEKGYYLTLLLYGLFSVISLQKSVRDRQEGIPITDIYYGLSWFSTIAAIVLLAVGLWNADLALSEKGFYGMAYALSLFAVITVQKNTRDLAAADQATPPASAHKSSKESSNKSFLSKTPTPPILLQTPNVQAADKAAPAVAKPATS
jgi:uncharacterized membrane protein YiaA